MGVEERNRGEGGCELDARRKLKIQGLKRTHSVDESMVDWEEVEEPACYGGANKKTRVSICAREVGNKRRDEIGKRKRADESEGREARRDELERGNRAPEVSRQTYYFWQTPSSLAVPPLHHLSAFLPCVPPPRPPSLSWTDLLLVLLKLLLLLCLVRLNLLGSLGSRVLELLGSVWAWAGEGRKKRQTRTKARDARRAHLSPLMKGARVERRTDTVGQPGQPWRLPSRPAKVSETRRKGGEREQGGGAERGRKGEQTERTSSRVAIPADC